MTVDSQRAFVVCAPITASNDWPGLQAKTVERELERLGNPAKPEIADAITRTVIIHFMSMSVLWPQDGEGHAYLLVEICGDSDKQTVLHKLVTTVGDYFADLARAAFGSADLAHFEHMLVSHAYEVGPNPIQNWWGKRATGLPFYGTPGLSVRRIIRDRKIAQLATKVVFGHPHDSAYDNWKKTKELTDALLVDIVDDPIKKKPERVRLLSAVRVLLFDSPITWIPFAVALFLTMSLSLRIFGWSFDLDEILPTLFSPLGLLFIFMLWIALILSVISVVAFLIVVGGIILWRLRVLERSDAEDVVDRDPDVEVVRQIMQRENATNGQDGPVYAQNHMTGISIVKPGFLRKWITLTLAFRLVQVAVSIGAFKLGFLSKVGTIHFAQWIRIPHTRMLIFFSNYDGSWESYLEDFITKSYNGINAIWSNTLGFPATNWLIRDGAADGDRFKRWARRQQIPTLFWYSAYPDLACAHIRRNAKIRADLNDPKMTPSAAEGWLRLFGSAARPAGTLESDQIQSLILSGQGKLEASHCLLIAFDETGEKARQWLGLNTLNVAFGGPDCAHDSACTVGFTARGLKRLGLRGIGESGGDFTQRFGPAFVLGMDNPTRQMVLGDRGVNAASEWDWGYGDEAVDAVLLIHGHAPDVETQLRPQQLEYLEQCGLRLVKEICLQTIKKDKTITEPFGFTDGISQPIIRGASPRPPFRGKDVVEPGEFILGYPDMRQNFPPTPLVKAEIDPQGTLPNGAVRGPDARDFGRNGSYLVIRQLEQDVKGFTEYTKTEAMRLGKGRTQEWVAAKMMGRWQNGAPLVRHPTQAPTGAYDPMTDQGFLYGLDDPQGLGCPFGAHIRRANPRDALDGDPQEIAITNRHRLLRRGRPYGELRENGPQQGILFMCFNADIERQFEFVQQNWIGSTSISALQGEMDPIATPQPDAKAANGVFTIPTVAGPERLQKLPSFVQVRGGAYFFVPSKNTLDFLVGLKPRNENGNAESEVASQTMEAAR